MKKYSDSDIIREYNRSTSAAGVARTMGISVNEVNKALKRAGINTQTIRRTGIDQEWHDTGLGKCDFIDDDNDF